MGRTAASAQTFKQIKSSKRTDLCGVRWTDTLFGCSKAVFAFFLFNDAINALKPNQPKAPGFTKRRVTNQQRRSSKWLYLLHIEDNMRTIGDDEPEVQRAIRWSVILINISDSDELPLLLLDVGQTLGLVFLDFLQQVGDMHDNTVS